MPLTLTAIDDNALRIRLGDVATRLALQQAGPGEDITSEHVEQAILALQTENRRLAEATSLADAPMVRPIKALIEREMDQLFHEFTQQTKANHDQTVDMFNGLRLMLTNLAEDCCSDEVLEAVTELNVWVDRAIKPMASFEKSMQRAFGSQVETT